MRIKDEKAYAVTGTKGYLWVEAEVFHQLGLDSEAIDYSYFDKLENEAVAAIDYFGSFTEFVR